MVRIEFADQPDFDALKAFTEMANWAIDWIVEEVIRQKNWRSLFARKGGSNNVREEERHHCRYIKYPAPGRSLLLLRSRRRRFQSGVGKTPAAVRTPRRHHRMARPQYQRRDGLEGRY